VPTSVPVENVADELVYEERDDSLERATTTATGLDAEQDRGVNTPLSGEDSLQLKELMEFCTKLQQKVLDLENTKTAQAHEITSLKKRVKKLERKKKLRTHSLKRLYKVGLSARIDSSYDEATLGDQEDASKQGRKIDDIDADNDITLDSTHFDTDPDMFGMHDLDSDKVFVETEEHVINAATTTSIILVSTTKDLFDVDTTLAQALAELKSTKPKAVTTAATTTITDVIRPKAKGLVIQEQEQASTPITSSKDKGKGIMVEEPLKMKKKDQDKVETDYELAQRLQVEEQEELTIEEKSKLFQELLEKRRKHFAAKRAEERRNRPPTKAQQRSIMCTYLKNMAGWKPKDLKTNKTREESSSKRAGEALEQESSKKQKVDDDKETEELKQFKARFKKTEPMNYMDTFLHLNLKTIFEHHLEDNVWKNQQGLVKVLNWKHYDSCGVHCVTMQNILYYLLVEKMYPFTKHKLHQMFNDVKLQVDYECEMAFELLRLVKKQVKEGYVPQ
ncbi:hypothetical protein Tco_0857081, partial [Tanacetum coccineum]